jgi:hypothetical protein
MKHNVNIECLDNGWLIRWTRGETDDEKSKRFLDQYRQMGFAPKDPKLHGQEIFTKHTDLLKRIKELTQ